MYYSLSELRNHNRYEEPNVRGKKQANIYKFLKSYIPDDVLPMIFNDAIEKNYQNIYITDEYAFYVQKDRTIYCVNPTDGKLEKRTPHRMTRYNLNALTVLDVTVRKNYVKFLPIYDGVLFEHGKPEIITHNGKIYRNEVYDFNVDFNSYDEDIALFETALSQMFKTASQKAVVKEYLRTVLCEKGLIFTKALVFEGIPHEWHYFLDELVAVNSSFASYDSKRQYSTLDAGNLAYYASFDSRLLVDFNYRNRGTENARRFKSLLCDELFYDGDYLVGTNRTNTLIWANDRYFVPDIGCLFVVTTHKPQVDYSMRNKIVMFRNILNYFKEMQPNVAAISQLGGYRNIIINNDL